ncbi:MAG TPA: hypothetical protein VKQ08_04955 [Cyclobacteriaceae bacterium]|nr:hypothetical protein [Cyclobacteriaceae bacterium]
MKKINLLLAGVLICTLVFARGIDGPIKGSSVAVTNVAGSTLYKLYYKSERSGRVKVSIRNEIGSVIFSEAMNKVDGFVRPYNFRELPEGQYTVSIEDESGKTVEKINYEAGKMEKLICVRKLAGEDKYVLSIVSHRPENVFIYIFDDQNNLIHNEIQSINGEFAQIYNLNDVKSFTIEVADKFGVQKKITY